MATIRQKDKRSGITYVYEASYYWDKEKKQSRSKRQLIGRLDEETGEVIPTDGRNRKPKEPKNAETQPMDYKSKYEKLCKKYEAQEILINTLKKEIKNLRKES